MADLPAPSSIPDLVQRYLNGEPIQSLATDARVSRQTLYNWIHRESTDPEIVLRVLINRLADSEHQLEICTDMLGLARARELNNNAKWQLERRVKMFNPKQEIATDNTIRVIIDDRSPLPVDITPESRNGYYVESQDVNQDKDKNVDSNDKP